MTLSELYNIEILNLEEDHVTAQVVMNASHSIFDGHFPEQPVLPGVTQLEILKNIIIKSWGEEVRLDSASNIKYLKMIDPSVDGTLIYEVLRTKNNEGWTISASSKTKGGEVSFKFKGHYILP